MGDVIRIGKVFATDLSNRSVRVQFADVGITSGWLKVIKTMPSNIYRTEVSEEHSHGINPAPWFPSVDDIVVCLYNPGFNEDGYVIGGL